MLYGTEACPVMSGHKHSLDFTVALVFMKILHTNSKDVVEECQRYFGFLPVSHHIVIRTARFLDVLLALITCCALFSKNKHKDTGMNSMYAVSRP